MAADAPQQRGAASATPAAHKPKTLQRTCAKCLLLVCVVSFVVSYLLVSVRYPDPQLWLVSNTSSWPTSPVGNLTSSLAVEMEEEMRRRRAVVMEACNKTNRPPGVGDMQLHRTLSKMYINKQYKVAWCPVYKAGSSSWLEVFAEMGHMLTPLTRRQLAAGRVQINNLARRGNPQWKPTPQNKEAVFSMTRFLIVRHPFERLLSAYRDKLEHRRGKMYYYERYGRQIVSLYRKKPPNAMLAAMQPREPTFPEFVRYVVERRRFDEHWRPYHNECSPCTLRYQYILKTESLDLEERYLVQVLGLHNLSSFHKASLRRIHNVNPSGRTGSQQARHYYSQVPQDLVQKLYQIYANDFEMFNYTATDYFNVTNR
ncbi:carbohydrate sulfotransferase 9-like [Bacillus rossius redtenbacheri]|uniref:carbohydrate sulfotransferase 9-like n=1 Tax=Bacillus rossius redtenbacheri TaxID=93214 RepID=UPI002FDE9ED6